VQNSIANYYSADTLTVLGLVKNETPIDWLTEYVASFGITFDMLYQADEVFQMYGVYYEPTYIVIDAEGQIRFRSSDYISFGNTELMEKIQQLVEG